MAQTPFSGRGRMLAATAAVAVVAAAPAAVQGATASHAAKPAAQAARGQAVPAAARMRRKRLRVTLRDFTIKVRHKKRVHAGRFTIHVTNLGPTAHNLTIRRRGFPTKATPTIAAGQTATIKIRLRRGRYTLFCSVPGHVQLGMLTRLRVRRHL